MAGDKEDQQTQQQHIPTDPQNDDQEKGNQGTGGLLSMVGDPAGELPIHTTNPCAART
jgi:hypothetical protein